MVFSYTSTSNIYASLPFLNLGKTSNESSRFISMYFDPIKGNMERMKKLQSYIFQLNQLRIDMEETNVSG